MLIRTDGTGFVSWEDSKQLKDIEIVRMRTFHAQLYILFPGIWYLPVDTRITLIPEDDAFYDVNSKQNISSGWYQLLDSDIKVAGFKIKFLKDLSFEQVLEELVKNPNLIEKGNILSYYNKIQLYDWMYK